MKKNNSVALTGSNGAIGTYLTQELKEKNINVLKLLSPLGLTEIEEIFRSQKNKFEVLLDLGWDTKDRSEQAQIKSANTSILLAKFCKTNNVRYIFVSSLTAIDPHYSQYGKAKKYVESVISENGIVIRPGFVIFHERVNVTKNITINRRKLYIPTVGIEDLVSELLNGAISSHANHNLNLITGVSDIKNVFQITRYIPLLRYRITIKVILKILVVLRSISIFNKTIDRFYGLLEVDDLLKRKLIKPRCI
jgi:hypothetical protein